MYDLALFFVTTRIIVVSLFALLLHISLDLIEDRLKLNGFELPLFLTKQFIFVLVAYFLVSSLNIPLFSGVNNQTENMYVVISFALITVFTVKFIDVVYEQTHMFGEKRAIEFKYKALSVCERIIMLILLMLGFYYLIPLVFIPRIYFQRTEILTKYRTDLLIGTTFTVLVYIILISA
jgi:hypothetical protein